MGLCEDLQIITKQIKEKENTAGGYKGDRNGEKNGKELC